MADLVISGGSNIHPSDLEAALRKHPAGADVAVVGVPSKLWGETVAFVVRDAGRAESEAELLQWFSARMRKTQRLAALRFIDEGPRGRHRQVLKRELRELHRTLALHQNGAGLAYLRTITVKTKTP